MAIFTIFWCVVLAIILWFLSITIKSIQSIFNGTYDAVLVCSPFVALAIFGYIILFLLYLISYGIRTRSLFTMILTAIVIGLVLFLIISFGAVIIEIVAGIVVTIIGFCIGILEVLNSYVERTYVFLLNKIKQKIDLL